tara:strand:- start:76 stop:513 length:438 start_codon:yes stop_codon:yes gene_type:complete
MIDCIKKLENKRVDKIIAGGSNGSIILLDLVDSLEKNVLYVYSAWRLSLNNKILTGSNDDSESNESVFVVELKKLENDIVKKTFTNVLGDFALEFSSGKKLDVFSDITSNGGSDDVRENWVVCNISKNICYNFTNRFDFYEESYN